MLDDIGKHDVGGHEFEGKLKQIPDEHDYNDLYPDDDDTNEAEGQELSVRVRQRESLRAFYGKELPAVNQNDVLKLCFKPDEHFFVCKSKRIIRAVCTGELEEESSHLTEMVNETLGATDDTTVRALPREQFMTFNAVDPTFGKRGQVYVTGLHSFVIEYDDLSLPRQLEMWSASDMPFTVKLFSAGKSVHVLVRFNRNLSLDEWDDITVKTIAFYDGVDSSLLTDFSGLWRTPLALRDDGKRTEQTVLEMGKIVSVDEFVCWLDRELEGVASKRIDDLRKARLKTRRTGPLARSKKRRERIASELSADIPTHEEEEEAATVASGPSFDEAPGAAIIPAVDCNTQTLGTLQAYWDRHLSERHRPRTYRFQGAMLEALNKGCKPKDILAAFRNWGVCQKWHEDHPEKDIVHNLTAVVEFFDLKKEAEQIVRGCLLTGVNQERRILACIKKADAWDYFADEGEARWFVRQQRSRYWGKHPVGRFPTKNIHCDGKPISPALEAMRTKFEGVKGGYSTRTRSGDIAFRLMEQVLDARQNALLDLPPGSMKTTASLLAAAARATPKSRWWLVYETVADVRDKARVLRDLGCRVRAWHAFNPGACTNEDVPKDRNAFRTAPKEHCRSCDDRAGCPAHHRQTAQNRWDPEDCDILVTTHAHWKQSLLHDVIPASVAHVIVDESPALSEGLDLKDADVEFLRSILGGPKAELFVTLGEFQTELASKLGNGDCAQIEFHVPDMLRRRILGFLHGDESPLNGLPEDRIDLIYSFLSFFRGPGLRFGVKQYQRPPDKNGDRGPLVASFLREQVDLACKQHTLVLDGSATITEVKWQGFERLRCSELAQTFPNMEVHVIDSRPSQGKIADEKCFAELREQVLDLVRNQPQDEDLILFTNKYLERKPKIAANVNQLRSAVEVIHPETVHMEYGDHIGSNKGVDATACVFAMALFAPYSHYVLRAAVADEMPIEADRIWREGQVFGNPKIGKYRFKDGAIHAAYVRSVSRDIVQGIYRGRIRHDSRCRYRVLIQVKSLAVIKFLEKQFPGAVFHYRDRKIVEAVEEGMSKSRLAEQAGEDKDVTHRQLLDDVGRVIDELQFAPPDAEEQ